VHAVGEVLQHAVAVVGALGEHVVEQRVRVFASGVQAVPGDLQVVGVVAHPHLGGPGAHGGGDQLQQVAVGIFEAVAGQLLHRPAAVDAKAALAEDAGAGQGIGLAHAGSRAEGALGALGV